MIILLITLLINIIYLTIKNKVKTTNKLLILFLVLTLPIYINCILLIMPTATMQLLMSSAYILLIPFLFSIENNKVYKVITIILISLLIRNYTIQANATYKQLEITHHKILTITDNIITKINELGYDKEIMITGNLNNNDYYNYNTNLEIDKLNNLTLGFPTKYPFFWYEYSNTKNGWTRYLYQYKGINIKFTDQETYNEIISSDEYKSLEPYPSNYSITTINDVIVIKLS